MNPPEQSGIRRQLRPLSIEPEIVLEPDPHAPAIHDRDRIGSELRRTDSTERPGCSHGEAADEHAHLLEVGLRARDVAHDDIEIVRGPEDALVNQVGRVVDHPGVEALEFGHNSTLIHLLDQPLDHLRRVHARFAGEVERSECERRHVGPQLQNGRPLFELRKAPATQRGAEGEIGAVPADTGKDIGVDFGLVARAAVCPSRVQVHDADADLIRLVDLLHDLRRADRHMRRGRLRGHHACGCEIDDE